MNDSVSVRTPRLPERLLSMLVANSELLDDLLDTMDEQFQHRCKADGVHHARRWYWRESIVAALYLVRDSLGRESRARIALRVAVAIVAHLGAIAAVIVGNGLLSRALPRSMDETIACALFTTGAIVIAASSALFAGSVIRENVAAARCAAFAGSATLLAAGALHIATTSDPAPLWFRVLLLATVALTVPLAASWRGLPSPSGSP